MIRAEALNSCLEQVLTNGIETVGILTLKGEVLAARSINPNYSSSQEYNLFVSIVTNAWLSYSTTDLVIDPETNQPDPEFLQDIFLEVGEKRLMIMGIANQRASVFLIAEKTVPIGMLKLITASLQQHLDDPMRSILL